MGDLHDRLTCGHFTIADQEAGVDEPLDRHGAGSGKLAQPRPASGVGRALDRA